MAIAFYKTNLVLPVMYNAEVLEGIHTSNSS